MRNKTNLIVSRNQIGSEKPWTASRYWAWYFAVNGPKIEITSKKIKKKKEIRRY